MSCSTATGLPGPSTSPGSMSRWTITPEAGAVISERASRSRADSTRATNRFRFTLRPQEVLRRTRLALDQELRLGVVQFRSLEFRLRLGEGRAQQVRTDPGQQRALLDAVSLVEADLFDGAPQLRGDHHLGPRFEATGNLQHVGEESGKDGRGLHGGPQVDGIRRFRCRLGGEAVLLAAPGSDEEQGSERERQEQRGLQIRGGCHRSSSSSGIAGPASESSAAATGIVSAITECGAFAG